MLKADDKVRELSVCSADGTNIGYKVLGEGPGLLIIPGAFRTSRHYLALAEFLSNALTVYIMDRRGRGGSGPQGKDYGVRKECEDAEAILARHNIEFLFGHSFGGVVALNVALHYPLAKLALFEPLLLDSFPAAWLPKFEREMAEENYIAASVTFRKGLRLGGPFGLLPKPLLKILFRPLAKGPDWEKNISLLQTVASEVYAGQQAGNDIARYGQIAVPTLIMSGTKSPRYLRKAAERLEDILPNGRRMSFPGLNHNAPDKGAPGAVAPALKGFFGG